MNSFRNLSRIGLLTFLMGCCSGMAGSELSSPPVVSHQPSNTTGDVNRLKMTTVAVVKEMSGFVLATCAGVWIDHNLIVTASHCVDDDPPMFKYSTEEDYEIDKSRNAVLIASDSVSDLALLLVDPDDIPEHPVASFSERSINSGDNVHVVGHTSGYSWTYSRGYISSIRMGARSPTNAYIKKVLQISAPVWMGNSGGGAFDDDGKLIGISSWVSANGPQLSFFIHKDVVQEFLLKHMTTKK